MALRKKRKKDHLAVVSAEVGQGKNRNRRQWDSWNPGVWCRWHLLCLYVFPLCFCLSKQHMEVPRLGVESELQLPAYTTATATPDPSHVCDLHHSSQQHWIPNPLSKARDRTHKLMVPSQIRFHCTTMGTPGTLLFMYTHDCQPQHHMLINYRALMIILGKSQGKKK